MTRQRRTPHVGDRPVVFVDVTDQFGAPTNPTDGSLVYRKPDSTTVEVLFASLTVAPDHGAGALTGRVEYTMPVLDQPGEWLCWWQFTAGVEAAEPFQFDVGGPLFTLP